MKYEFDLEDATHGLEQINDLLCIYKEFVDNECPENDTCGDDAKLAAQLFASRTRQFSCLIDAAQDKIIAICNEMETTIEKYHQSKKKGGDVA